MPLSINPYALLSAAVAVVNLLIGYTVFKKRPHHPLNRVYGLLTILVGALWPFAEFMLRMADEPLKAFFWARIAWTPVLLAPAIILHLALVLTKQDLQSRDRWKIRLAYSISLLFVTLNYTTKWVISGAHREFWGYTGSFGWVLKYLCSTYHFIIVFYVLSMLYRRYRISEKIIEKIQLRLVSIGIAFPYVGGAFAQMMLPILGFRALPIASTTTIIMDAFIAYAIIRYKLLIITPTVEDEASGKPKYAVKSKTYLITAKDSSKAWDMYVDQILHGRQGLCVTLKNPDEVRGKYNIEKTPIIWLTTRETRHKAIPPKDLEQLIIHLLDFFRISRKNSIVLLDGIDELIELNGLEKVFAMIKELNLETSKTETSLIIPIERDEDLKLIQIQLQKDDILKEIDFAKKRFHKREIDEESFREIVKEFEKELIELDLATSKLEGEEAGEGIEIME
ncbi:MAG: DUF835 domain-containing protein [Candidatus Altiarchaeota archaeon]